MQKCSELTSNPEVWQSLSRYGLPALKVKRGPEGHQLAETCHDQLKKVLPVDAYEKLMTWVARWLKSLDEKDAKTRLRTKADETKTLPGAAKPELPIAALSKPKSVKDTVKKDSSFVDLCSDDDTKEVQTENSADGKSQKEDMVFNDHSCGHPTQNKVDLTKEKDHVEVDKHASEITDKECVEYAVRPTSKTYLNTKKPKVQKALIRVRTDLKANVKSSKDESQKKLRLKSVDPSNRLQFSLKRKLCTERPKKACDSTTQETFPKKPKFNKDLAELLQESVEEASSDITSSTIVNTSEPNLNPVLGLTHILGLLDCVESYATWQHNLDAIALLVKLRDTLQNSR